MAWKAYLVSVQDNAGQPPDSINIEVKYEDSDQGRSVTKNYNLSFGNFQSLAAVRDLIVIERDKFSTFDNVKEILIPYVGMEIT